MGGFQRGFCGQNEGSSLKLGRGVGNLDTRTAQTTDGPGRKSNGLKSGVPGVAKHVKKLLRRRSGRLLGIQKIAMVEDTVDHVWIIDSSNRLDLCCAIWGRPAGLLHILSLSAEPGFSAMEIQAR
jgi:hypothetical protein